MLDDQNDAVKSMRFATVVEKSGKPDVHLMLVAPEKDTSLQRAIKAHRVMTLHQTGAADFGVVGFEEGVSGQILVFPKSLRPFEGSRIVGVKYELLEDAPKPKAPRSKSTAKEKEPSRKPSKNTTRRAEPPPPEKVVAFKRPEPEPEEEEEDQRVLDLEAGIHHAMEMLEAGKQVAAFNILKRLVD